jgi:hypothetical protein
VDTTTTTTTSSTPESTDNDDEKEVATSSATTNANNNNKDDINDGTTQTKSTKTMTAEEKMEYEQKIRRLAREYGVNLGDVGLSNMDGSPQRDDDAEDDDDTVPDDPNHDDDELYGKSGINNNNNNNTLPNMEADTSQHRSTNIGVPARPDDPVAVDGKTIHVLFCYSKYEIMEGTRFEDTVGQFHLPLSYEAIKKEALEFYNEEESSEYFSLEYYHKKKWYPLNENCYDIMLHYHQEQILHQEDYQTLFFIRMPFMYDTSDYPEEEDTGMGEFNSLTDAAMGNFKDGKTPKPPPTLQDKIIETLNKIQRLKYQRDPKSPSPYNMQADITKFQLIVPVSEYVDDYDENNTQDDDYAPISVSTRQYILNLCTRDYDLRDILLLNVNGLPHMVRCLHYDIYWDFPLPKRQDVDASEQDNEDRDEGYDLNDDDDDTYRNEHDDDFNTSQTSHSDHKHDHSHNHEHTAACQH